VEVVDQALSGGGGGGGGGLSRRYFRLIHVKNSTTKSFPVNWSRWNSRSSSPLPCTTAGSAGTDQFLEPLYQSTGGGGGGGGNPNKVLVVDQEVDQEVEEVDQVEQEILLQQVQGFARK
jgi:hypothetical protein